MYDQQEFGLFISKLHKKTKKYLKIKFLLKIKNLSGEEYIISDNPQNNLDKYEIIFDPQHKSSAFD